MQAHQAQNDGQEQQSSHSSSSQNHNKFALGYRKYSRITPQMKDKLIFLIVRSNMSIKQAAQYLKINYSSAKFIFSQYRDKNFQPDHPTPTKTVVCVTRQLRQQEEDEIELKYTVGGKYEGSTVETTDPYKIYSMSK